MPNNTQWTDSDLKALAEETMLKIDRTYAFIDQAAHIEAALRRVLGMPEHPHADNAE